MKKHLLLSILFSFLAVISSFGQTDTAIRRIFYGINPELSREGICRKLKADARFLENSDTAVVDFGQGATYFGKANNGGMLKSPADSINVAITIQYGSSLQYCVFKLQYYFSSADSAMKMFSYLNSYIAMNLKKTADKGTILKSDYTHTVDTGVNMTYKLKGEHDLPSLTVTKWAHPLPNQTTHRYCLDIEYKRLEY